MHAIRLDSSYASPLTIGTPNPTFGSFFLAGDPPNSFGIKRRGRTWGRGARILARGEEAGPWFRGVGSARHPGFEGAGRAHPTRRIDSARTTAARSDFEGAAN